MGQKKNQTLNKDLLERQYKDMLLIRRFEEKAGQMYGMGKIGGFCHLYIGQEAVAVGIKTALTEKDSFITSYRCHGHALLGNNKDRLTSAKEVLAELMGKATGGSKGKGGSMHIFDTDGKFYGGHGIVGAQVSLGTGLAFAHQYKEDGGLCATFMGDGAVNQGQVAESFNMAALWKLPVIFIIENNEYAMGTSVARSSYNNNLSQKGLSFGIEGRQVNGMDILEVYKATKEAAEYVRSGKGPLILEMKTYRFRGHSMSDPAKYRTKDELEKYKDLDPIISLKAYLLENKILTEDEFKEIDKEIKNIVQEAVTFAEESPEPDVSELTTEIFN